LCGRREKDDKKIAGEEKEEVAWKRTARKKRKLAAFVDSKRGKVPGGRRTDLVKINREKVVTQGGKRRTISAALNDAVIGLGTKVVTSCYRGRRGGGRSKCTIG